MGQEQSELERQIAELRAALEKMNIDAQVKDSERNAELADIREMVTSVQATLDEVRRVLLGNSEAGVVNVLDQLVRTVEGLGRLFERLHYEGQQHDKAFSELLNKWRADNTWRGVAQLLLDIMASQNRAARQRL